MAVNKNFVVKNGLEVGTNLIFGDASDRHVGLGTTAPLTTLDVRGDVRFADSDEGVTNTVDIAGETTINKDLKVGSGGTTAFFDVDTGYVGINSTSPRFSLDVRVSAGDTLAASFDADISAPNINITSGGTFADLNVTGITTTAALRVVGVTTLAEGGGITTTGGDLFVGGDLYVLDDVVYDEVTGRNINISGVGTIADLNVTGNGTIASLDVSGNTVLTGVTTLASSGGITTTGGDLFVGGDLYVADDIVYDEVTGRNINITGVGTFGTQLDVGNGNFIVESDGDISTNIRTHGHIELDSTGTFTSPKVKLFSNSGNAEFEGEVTATRFIGEGQIGVASEGTFMGVGVTMVDFKSSNAQNTVDVASGIATVTVTTGVSIGLVIALGS
tara:strand:- start:1302 stop:2465 length:1164 start_codon:yes stop_codon:yes gene_type:complete